MANVPKLKGRENFDDWSFAVENLLILDGLNGCIDGTETDADKISKAKAKLILTIDASLYVHIKEPKSAKELWDKLKSLFADSGFTRKINLLRALISTRLEDCDSMGIYVNQIVETAQKLRGTGFKIDEEWIGSLLLAGLPEKFSPMIMAIEHSGIDITADSIKTKLLDMEVDADKSGSAFAGKGKMTGSHSVKQRFKVGQPCAGGSREGINVNNVKCYNCKQFGHFKNKCPNKTVRNLTKQKPVNAFSVVFLNGQFSKNDWYIDSGASVHLTPNQYWMENVSEETNLKEIMVANRMKTPVTCKGDVNITTLVNDKKYDISVKGILCVPELTTNLLSVSQLIKSGNTVKFEADGCKVFNRQNVLVATANLVENVYRLNINESLQCSLAATSITANVWHRRFGHINNSDLKKMKNGIVSGVTWKDQAYSETQSCVVCCEGKQTRAPFKNKGSRAKGLLDVIHMDVCGPMENKSIGGARYFLLFVDDYSRMVFIYFLKTKDQVIDCFKEFKAMVENQLVKKIKVIRSDNGLEFCNANFNNFLKQNGIIHQLTNPYTPEQNGMVERMNRTVVEKARCMIFDAKLDMKFWAEAANTAVYLINRSVSSGLVDKTPFEMWYGKKPDVSNIRIFGSDVMVHIPKVKRTKWNAKSQKMILVGYEQNVKGYRLFNPINNNIITSRDVVIMESDDKPCILIRDITDNERITDSVGESAGTDDCIEKRQNTEEEDESANDPDYSCDGVWDAMENQTLRRSQREPKPIKMDDYVSYLCANKRFTDDPMTVEEAIVSKDSSKWEMAMKEEFDSLIKNGTWNLAELPKNKKVINCKWVFKSKTDDEGNVMRYKARLVAKGCGQRKGIDYQETYSPVVRYSSIRYLISIAAEYDLDIYQMDVVTAFLHGELSDELYMKQPEFFDDQTGRVCRLNKSIYGLKQASRQWNIKFNEVLLGTGFKQSELDPCVYYCINDTRMTFVSIYVDDLMIFTNDEHMTSKLKNKLMNSFEMKDLGEAKNCVGLHITRNRVNGTISIDQTKYIKEILENFGMTDCKPVASPADPNVKLNKNMSPKMDEERNDMANVPYQEAVGSILYLANGSRPDISFAVNNVSRFNKNPGRAHWQAVKRILRYLKGTIDTRLEFTRSGNTTVKGFTDADWAGDVDDRRSCTGYVFLRNGGAIAWNSRKQQTVALSSTEAEYMSLSSAVQEAAWLRQFESEFWPCEPITIYSDNRGAICLCENNGFNSKSKHIDIRHHYVRQKVRNGEIKICFVPSEEMVGDSLTKPVTTQKFIWCTQQMGLHLNS